MTVPDALDADRRPPGQPDRPQPGSPMPAPGEPPRPAAPGGYPPPLAPVPPGPRPLAPALAPLPPSQAIATSQQIGLAPQLVRPASDPRHPSAISATDETIGGQTWAYDSGLGVVEPRSATQVLSTLAGKVAQGDVTQYQPVPLGFTPLDKSIGGGIRAGEMLLIGGAQGTGKTTMALQMARNIVMSGLASVLYICFEHDEEYLLNRIIAQESVAPQPAQPGRRGEARGRPPGDPGHLDGDRRPERRPGHQPSPAPGARARQPLRAQPLPAAGLPNDQHGREHERARAALQGAGGRPPPRGLHRLHAEGAGAPGARQRGREGHHRRAGPQGPGPQPRGAAHLHRGRGQGGPQGRSPAQPSPARLVSHQLRG